MKKIALFSVKFPISVMMLVLATLLLGYISFDRLGIDLFPDLNTPRIFIELKAGERPPEDLEQQFVRNLESLAIRQRNVREVSSVTRSGSARITVEYAWETDMDEAFLDLQKNVNSFAQNSDLDEINITQHDPNTAAIMLIGIRHPDIDDMDAMRRIGENYIRNELVRLEGIAAVEVLGGETRRVIVEADLLQLNARSMTIEQLAARIRASNVNAAGGSMEEHGRRYIIKGVGAFKSIDEIGEVIISQSGTPGTSTTSTTPRLVRLRDIAEIYFANDQPANIVQINGHRSIAVAVYKETGYNTVKAAETLTAALADIQKALPDYQFTVIENQAEFIAGAIGEVEQTALIGIVLAVLVLYFFLRRIGTTMVISCAIPISIVATFNLMFFNDLSLNIMTLGGLALGAGMLVDNAIVVVENIFRHLEKGAGLHEAAVAGTAEVGGAITASTLTTIIVFLPIVYLHGAAGELFKDQAWTVAFSLLSSLVVAILVIPMLSLRFLKKVQNPRSDSVQFSGYGDFLRGVLRKRTMVLLTAGLMALLALLLLPIIGSEFMPRADSRSFKLDLELPEGTSLAFTSRAAESVETIIGEVLGSDLEIIYTRVGPVSGLIGGSAPDFFEDDHTATISVSLKSAAAKNGAFYIEKLRAVLNGHPDMSVAFSQQESSLQSTLGVAESPLQIDFKGDDLTVLELLTRQAGELLDSLPEIKFSRSNFEEGRPEINIEIDRQRAGVMQIDPAAVSAAVEDRLEGRVSSEWIYQGEGQDIVVRTRRPDINTLPQIYITSGPGAVRLDDLARIRHDRAPREIFRENQSRIGRLSLQPRKDIPLSHISDLVAQKLSAISLPPEYTMAISGESSRRESAFGGLQFALLLSIILIYMVLAAQFESLLHPFTIILTIPLAAVGAIFIFFLFGEILNIMAFIGIIMLVGIAVNDSIILVDAINQYRREGQALQEAIVAAGERRIRPIIMTSLTTILALLPLTFGFGEGAALRAPMALAVIGGLFSSTALTLLVIPCAYSLVEEIRLKFSNAHPDTEAADA